MQLSVWLGNMTTNYQIFHQKERELGESFDKTKFCCSSSCSLSHPFSNYIPLLLILIRRLFVDFLFGKARGLYTERFGVEMGVDFLVSIV